jgi:hypothetical protein
MHLQTTWRGTESRADLTDHTGALVQILQKRCGGRAKLGLAKGHERHSQVEQEEAHFTIR